MCFGLVRLRALGPITPDLAAAFLAAACWANSAPHASALSYTANLMPGKSMVTLCSSVNPVLSLFANASACRFNSMTQLLRDP